MNNGDNGKSWAYWFKKGIECSAPCIFIGFLICCACKYAVSGGAWFVIALLILCLF